MNGKYNDLCEWGRAVFVTVVCFIAAISIALFIVVNISPLFITIPQKALGLSSGEINGDYWRIIAFLQLPWSQQLKLHDIPITCSAIRHFGDVRRLFLVNELLMVVASFLSLKGLTREKRQAQLWRLNLPFQMVIFVILFGGFMLVTNFDVSFIQFHYLLFSNMDWVFSPQSNPIILLMPQSFFALLFLLVVIIAFTIVFLIWLWIKLSLRAFLRQL